MVMTVNFQIVATVSFTRRLTQSAPLTLRAAITRWQDVSVQPTTSRCGTN